MTLELWLSSAGISWPRAAYCNCEETEFHAGPEPARGSSGRKLGNGRSQLLKRSNDRRFPVLHGEIDRTCAIFNAVYCSTFFAPACVRSSFLYGRQCRRPTTFRKIVPHAFRKASFASSNVSAAPALQAGMASGGLMNQVQFAALYSRASRILPMHRPSRQTQ